jgi:NAD(P)-dependent dehydrogenase (short-subunit alcohol dehydrogenase family)
MIDQEDEGPQTSVCGRFELTFMVNVLSSFMISHAMLTEMKIQPQRIINSASEAHHAYDEEDRLDFRNL